MSGMIDKQRKGGSVRISSILGAAVKGSPREAREVTLGGSSITSFRDLGTAKPISIQGKGNKP